MERVTDGPLIVQSDKTLLLEVDHPDAPAISAAERAEGKILACCAVPLTDLVIK